MSYSADKILIRHIEKLKDELYKVYDSGDWKKTVVISKQLDTLLNQLHRTKSETNCGR